MAGVYRWDARKNGVRVCSTTKNKYSFQSTGVYGREVEGGWRARVGGGERGPKLLAALQFVVARSANIGGQH